MPRRRLLDQDLVDDVLLLAFVAIGVCVLVLGAVALLLSATPADAQSPDRSYVAPDGRTFDQLVEAHVLPDPDHTPGVLNDAVTDATLSTTVCSTAKDARGHDWVHDQRPPDSYTDPMARAATPPGHQVHDGEWDHLFSIEDGGAPRDPRNLWWMIYQDRYGARVKDVLETKVHRLLCLGRITFAQARDALAPNWLLGYVRYVGPLP